MSEWFESLKNLVSERVGNPIIFAYSIAWLFVNYHVVLMIFSDADVMEKISFVPAEYADWQDRLYYLGLPLIVALVYSLGAPWLRHLILWYDFWQGKFTRALKVRHENSTLITVAERDELVSKHQQKVDRLHEEMSRRATYYSDLSQEKDSLVKRVSELDIKLGELESKNSLMETAQISLNNQLRSEKDDLEALRGAVQDQFDARADLRAAIPVLRGFVKNINKPTGPFEKVEQREAVERLLISLEKEFNVEQ